MPTSLATRRILAAAIAFATFAAGSNQASAVSLSLELACAADYYTYCSQHDPDGPGVRKCFRATGEKLSQRCLNALVKAGEVSRSEIESRSAKK